MKLHIHPRHTFAELARVVVGVLFVFSGLMKSIDPVGTSLKVHEYLAPLIGSSVGGHTLSLGTAFVLSGGEFLLGAFLLMGIYRRLCARLTLIFMVLMTLLTFYIWLYNPVTDCGCFGDAIHLTNSQTLIKNLILLPLSWFVWRDARSLRHLYSRRERWLPALLAVVGIIVFMEENYRRLPYVDFRPYAVGTNLREAISQEETQLQQTLLASTQYIYKKDGREQAFTAETLPDSSWHFVEARQDSRLSDFRPRYDFALLDSLGESVTSQILESQGITLLLATPSWRTANQGVIDETDELYHESRLLGYNFYGVSASSAEDNGWWRYQTGATYPMLFMDATAIKTMVRAMPGLVVLRDGLIIDKRSYADFPRVEDVDHYLKALADKSAPLPYPSPVRLYLLWLWAALLVFAFLRFWARKLHLTRYLHLRRKLHLHQ